MKCSRGHSPATAGLRRCSGPWACCEACARRVRSGSARGESPRGRRQASVREGHAAMQAPEPVPAGRARACVSAMMEMSWNWDTRGCGEMRAKCAPLRAAPLETKVLGLRRGREGRWQAETPRLRGDGGAVPQPLRAERPSQSRFPHTQSVKMISHSSIDMRNHSGFFMANLTQSLLLKTRNVNKPNACNYLIFQIFKMFCKISCQTFSKLLVNRASFGILELF